MSAISSQTQIDETGFLLNYGIDSSENYRRAAVFVDKILKGAKPSDLPVEFATKVNFIVNLKTAKALDIEVPEAVLQLADKIIE